MLNQLLAQVCSSIKCRSLVIEVKVVDEEMTEMMEMLNDKRMNDENRISKVNQVNDEEVLNYNRVNDENEINSDNQINDDEKNDETASIV
jgi:hypothetical protein